MVPMIRLCVSWRLMCLLLCRSWRQWCGASFEAVAVEEEGWAGEPFAGRC